MREGGRREGKERKGGGRERVGVVQGNKEWGIQEVKGGEKG